jgi:PTH2 family peptidyl-tRNA hydrolase
MVDACGTPEGQMNKFKQVLVVRNDLNMRKGKMVAQGAHASIMVLVHRLCGETTGSKDYAIQEWLSDGMTKICVRVDSEAELLEIAKQAEDAGLTVHVITDAGHTEFGGVPTRTCLAIGPDEEEKINAVTGKLKLL